MCARVQKLRKRRETSATRATPSKSVKVTAKVKIKVEQPDEVTCSTDNVGHQSTPADIMKRESRPDDTLLPDTTTDHISDVVEDFVTSARMRTVSAAVVGGSCTTPQQQLLVPAYSNTFSHPHTPYQHHPYANVHQAVFFYRDTAGGNEQRFSDDIDDVLSVMASVAGITQPHVYN